MVNTGTYYWLFIRRRGKWESDFGSFHRSEVAAELEDIHFGEHLPLADLNIVQASDPSDETRRILLEGRNNE